MRVQTLLFIIFLIIMIDVMGIFLIFHFKSSEETSKESGLETPLENISLNESQANETSALNESLEVTIPLPRKITGIDMRSGNSKYICNNETNPEHKVRLYTYKIVDGIKILPEEYLESNEVTDVCENYPHINISQQSVSYSIKWQWEAVTGIDGYRIYQYYYLKKRNITRDYNYYVELSSSASQLIDTGLDLWRKE